MKIYKFELVINEQSDEFFEEVTKDGKSGCGKQEIISMKL